MSPHVPPLAGPEYPGGQPHVYAPLVLVHEPTPQIPGVVTHSFTSTHVVLKPAPEIVYPTPHEHMYPPALFMQVLVALRSRPHALAGVHSLMSVQPVPPDATV